MTNQDYQDEMTEESWESYFELLLESQVDLGPRYYQVLDELFDELFMEIENGK